MSNEASILYLFYLILVPFYLLFVLQVASRQVDVPTEFIRSILCSNDIVKMMLQDIYPLFLFWFWYSSCFDVKCWFHTFPNRCSHISMGVLILLDHRDFHVNSFSTGVHFVRLKLSLFSPPSHPFLYGASNSKWNIHFILVMVLHSFPSMFLSGELSWRCSRASSSSFFCSRILPVYVIQDFGVDLILFLFSQCFLIPVHQLIILLLLFISGVLKIHNSILIPFKLFLRIVILLKPFNSTGAISLKQSI